MERSTRIMPGQWVLVKIPMLPQHGMLRKYNNMYMQVRKVHSVKKSNGHVIGHYYELYDAYGANKKPYAFMESWLTEVDEEDIK